MGSKSGVWGEYTKGERKKKGGKEMKEGRKK